MAEKVTIEVPEGTDPAKLLKLLEKYEHEKVAGKARDKAKRKAIKALIENHEEEYNNILAKIK